MPTHNFHQTIGAVVTKETFPNCDEIVKDSACGGKQEVPLFYTETKSNETKIAQVDLLIIQNSKVKVIIEIEESGDLPTKVFGKFFASAFSKYYIHWTKKNVPVSLSNSTSFIQIMDTSKKSIASSKMKQFAFIEEAIQMGLPSGKFKTYNLIYGSESEFEPGGSKRDELITLIKQALE